MAEQSSPGKLPARSLLCTALLSVVLRVVRPLLARCDGSFDVLFPQALAVVLRTGNFSISHLQRNLLLGYRRACRLMAAVEAANVVPRNPPAED